MSERSASSSSLLRTPLYALHAELGARFVPFAGYEMPVQYPLGVLGEHLHTRAKAGLFDVSHMGQAVISASGGHAGVARALERLVPGDIAGLAPGQMRYTLLLGEDGGILDDLMVLRPGEKAGDGSLLLVVNAATKHEDFTHIERALDTTALTRLDGAALLALQGPRAIEILSRGLCPDAAGLSFMEGGQTTVAGVRCHVTRSGYTGEDGVEISLPGHEAERVARALLADADVAPIGLGARDSLRLEAGLCLYGHDIDTTTSPIEAGLAWTIPKRRREEANFPGAKRILAELANGPARRRVGLLPEGKAPAREGTDIVDGAGNPIGVVTSGGFGPSTSGPVAMGYVARAAAGVGTSLALMVRGTARPARVAALPFVPHRYIRTKS